MSINEAGIGKRLTRSAVKADSPSCLKTTKGARYLKKFEVVRGTSEHASITWELTESSAEALVFCSEGGAGMVAVLFERYVRVSDSRAERFFAVLPVDLECFGRV